MFGTHFRIFFGLFWTCLGHIFGDFSDFFGHVWDTFGDFSDMFGTHFGHFLDIFRTCLGHFLDMFGNVLGTFWDHWGLKNPIFLFILTPDIPPEAAVMLPVDPLTSICLRQWLCMLEQPWVTSSGSSKGFVSAYSASLSISRAGTRSS